MDKFLKEQLAILNIIFIINQLNTLKTERDNDQDTINIKLGLY